MDPVTIADEARSRAPEPSPTARRVLPALRPPTWLEPVGYAAIAAALFAFLVHYFWQLQGFYLDEWLYTHASEYMWDHLPLGPVQEIPLWTRGPQRLYTVLLAPLWGPFGTQTAYPVSHLVNAVLLASAVAPAALLARRLIASPALRVLAVALSVGVPWLVIGVHLLTENLAFPLLLWSVYAIIRAAETPSLPTHAAALAAVAALALTRLNLAVMFGVLLLAVAVAEWRRWREDRHAPRGRRLVALLSRNWLTLAVTLLAAVVGVVFAAQGRFGSYGWLVSWSRVEYLWDSREAVWTTALTYWRSLVTGSFVFPIAIGIAAATAGACGRLGERFRVPGLVALASLVGVVLVVAGATVFGSLEERYVFYVYSPLALFAVAGVEHIRRLRVELVVAGALVTYALAKGTPFAGTNSDQFFAGPAGAFWTRVVEHRLVRFDGDWLGWLPGDPNGWLPIALALAALVAIVAIPWPSGLRLDLLLAGGLGLCLITQLAVLNYAFQRQLHGTPEAPGGLAGPRDGRDWIDRALPNGAGAALVPSMLSPAAFGQAEGDEFWNRSLDAVVALPIPGTPVPAPAGYRVIQASVNDGLIDLGEPGVRWLAVQTDDPRVQFPGRVVVRSPTSTMLEIPSPTRAVWTSAGLETDGYVQKGQTVTMSLARDEAPDVRTVVLRVRGPDAASRPTRWRILRAGRRQASGRVVAAQERSIVLRVPPCLSRGACEPVVWRLATSGPATGVALPAYGPPGTPRPVTLQIVAAQLRQ